METTAGWEQAPRTAVQTGSWDFQRALATVRRMRLLNILTAELDAKRSGRRRCLPWEAWFVAHLLAVMTTNGKAHMSVAQNIFDGFTPSQRWELGIRDINVTYAHLESGLETLTRALDGRVNKRTGEVTGPRLSITAHDIANDLIRATLPDNLQFTGEVAIDSTDFETDAARRSFAKHRVLVDREIPINPDASTMDTVQEVIDGKEFTPATHTTRGGNTLTFPVRGADDRWQHSIDPDARDGYRSGKQMMKKIIFLGYDLHIANMTPAKTGHRHAALAFGIDVAPAGSNKAAAGLRLIDRINASGHAITSVCVDRGYSMAKLENWALPLINRGITQHHDLGSNETRLTPGDQPGVIFLDGHPYLAVMPKRLRELRRPGLNATSEEVAASAQAYNERIPYAFSTNGPVRPNGSQRFRGPALTGKVRCPNHPASMRGGPHKPLTNCEPGKECACALTFTVKADDPRTKHRQPELYGTENWLKSYGARNLSESFNASVKNHHMTLKRHSTRVYGLTKNTLMLSFIIAATNIAVLRLRYGWDEGRPEMMPPRDQPLMLLPQRQPTGSNARHRKTPANGPPPDPVPGEEPWTDLN